MNTIRFPRRHAAAIPKQCARATATHAVTPRVGDLGEAWSAHAHRALRLLPPELHWAQPVLDPLRPRQLRCTREQACRLMSWHSCLPTHAQVSFQTTKRDPGDPPPVCA